jgi:ATPase subunit of ABC transporter with duplicated ATPase domains
MSTEPNKVIYSMVGVSKYYDKKAVLKDIYLSYFYGAKIGVIGLNGSGKSSLLHVLGGVDEVKGRDRQRPYSSGLRHVRMRYLRDWNDDNNNQPAKRS